MALHSFEKLPNGGVASPHTERTLRCIHDLKQKHGIDYDCHANYRFVVVDLLSLLINPAPFTLTTLSGSTPVRGKG